MQLPILRQLSQQPPGQLRTIVSRPQRHELVHVAGQPRRLAIPESVAFVDVELVVLSGKWTAAVQLVAAFARELNSMSLEHLKEVFGLLILLHLYAAFFL